MTERAKLALDLTINFFETENITVGTEEMTNIINKWDIKLPTADFISLAAVAISNPNEIALSEAEIREIREFYFPSKNYDERSSLYEV